LFGLNVYCCLEPCLALSPSEWSFSGRLAPPTASKSTHCKVFRCISLLHPLANYICIPITFKRLRQVCLFIAISNSQASSRLTAGLVKVTQSFTPKTKHLMFDAQAFCTPPAFQPSPPFLSPSVFRSPSVIQWGMASQQLAASITPT